ncbi:major facilitator superfamily mfs-1 [Trichoderma arundinaceum]|uniref:Major facilitator superfamily mfs-1 n=1 Tax=Trichoderma arundinaceum TaxID=490622 RepID=A0A395NIF4_TRIAR|nr:major facilitator superfamily mfs-1 [Trichoderma arundinaceum]
MASQQVSKYHIAPNFYIPPVEAGGNLQLGSLIASVAEADGPVNTDCHLHIPQTSLFCSHQKGFNMTRSCMKKGEYGLWVKLLGADGVGGELSWAPERSDEDVYHFRGIDTIYFKPSQAYMEESMNKDAVKEHLVGSGDDHVYMVTGLKTARGPSVKMSKSHKNTFVGELGVHEPGGLPIEFGPRFNASKEVRQEQGFEDSTDFIIGIRINKLMYKKHWLTRAPQGLHTKEYNKGATMVGDEAMTRGAEEVVDLGDDTENLVGAETEEIDGKSVTTAWVLD